MSVAAAALCTTALVGVSTAAAQTATINATATVLQPITATGAQDLAFGNVFPGVAKTIAYTDAANAGQFSISGDGGANVTISFTLPTDLTGPSSSTLPIGSWTGYHNATNSSTSGGTAFTPSATAESATLSGTSGTAGSLFVFLGATVTPTTTQTQGSYTGTVQMTVAYTGS
jgi:hypothetical protein